jgi:TonB-linked SusC/RagA family outer membrane protein
MLFKALSNCRFVPFSWPIPRFFTKTLRVMKLTALLLTVFALHVSAKVVSQTVSFSGHDVPLEKVFSTIEQQTGYVVFCDYALLKDARPVTMVAKDLPLEEFLMNVLKGQALDYSITKKTIVIKPRQTPRLQAGDTSRLPDPKDPPEVVGNVTDEDGEPLTGASIKLKNGKVVGITDAKGNFILKNISDDAILEISFTGFTEEQVVIKGKRVFKISLKRADNKLDQVQVIAYGTTTERLNTGDVTTVSSKEIEQQPVSNPLAALEGRVPGLFITENTGVPGGGFTVQIRGQNSIASGNNPFYIIDGVPFTSTTLSDQNAGGQVIPNASPLNTINPNDIESIEVLKDADATSIYGSRGANGVILITTKKGHAGKTKFDINAHTGYGKITRMMHLLNTSQYLAIRQEAFYNDGAVPQASDYDVNGTYDSTRYTDWQKALLGGTAKITNAQASLSGGDANTQFLFGGGFYRQTSVFPGDFVYQRLSGHLNLTHVSPNKRLRFELTQSYSSDVNNQPSQDVVAQALTLPPNAPALYDSGGNINWANQSWPNFGINPLYYLAQKYKGTNDNLITNAIISYQILTGLRFKASLGYNDFQVNETRTYPISSYNPAWGITTGQAQFVNSSIKTWIVEPQLEYDKTLGNGKVILLIGSTFQQNLQTSQSVIGAGFTSDALLGNIQSAATITPISSLNTEYRYNAVFARLNYTLNSKYFINVTARRDGSSRFGPGKQFADFGAIGAAWVFTNEKYIQQRLSWLSFGKIRASYGITGNDQIGDYQYLDTYTSTNYPYQGAGLIPTRLANPDYAWEINKKAELGIEFGFLKDRLLITGNYYKNRSSNQLLGYALPLITGFSSVEANLPAIVQNTGWEFLFNTAIVKTKNILWNVILNFTVPNNKLIAYPNLINSSYADIYTIGQPLSSAKYFHYTGVDPATGLYSFTTKNSTGVPTYPQDLISIKKTGQDFYGGLQNTFIYHSFQLDFLFQFVKQTGVNYISFFEAPGMESNQPTLVLNHWKKPGDISGIQMYTQDFGSAANTAYSNAAYNSDRRISDASFIRLKNVSVSWQVSSKWLQKISIRQARVYFQGQNLLTFTHYLGLDPENTSFSSIPPLRILTAGIQITF